MRTLKTILFALLSMACMLACTKTENEANTNTNNTNNPQDTTITHASNLSRMDIANASTLFIGVPATNTKSAVENLSSAILYKITVSGVIEQVKYYDEGNKAIDLAIKPTTIYAVSSNFVIIAYGKEGYLVNKASGKAHSLSHIGLPEKTSVGFLNQFVRSYGNTAYYQTHVEGRGFSQVVKLDLNNPDNPTIVAITPEREDIRCFQVDSKGNVLYSAWSDKNGTLLKLFRLLKVNGTIEMMPDFNYDIWMTNDNFYFSDGVITSKVTTTNNQASISTYANQYYSTDGAVFLSCSNRAYGLDDYYGLTELCNTQGTIKKVTITEISQFDNGVATNGYLYLTGYNSAGKQGLVKMNVADNSVQTLIPFGTYEISSLNVSTDDVLTFSAIRVSDGAKLIGRVSATGQVSILNESQPMGVVGMASM